MRCLGPCDSFPLCARFGRPLYRGRLTHFLATNAALCALFAWCAVGSAQAKINSQAPLRTLVTARAAHDLPLPEGRRSYPVPLRRVCTSYAPFYKNGHGGPL